MIFGLLIASIAPAQEHRAVVTFPPGSQSDTIARALSDAMARQTGQRLIIHNLPGADTVIGTVQWRDNGWPVIFTSSGQLVANIVTRPDLPYSDNDFDHVIYLGSTPAIWVASAKSSLRSIKDLVTKANRTVGGYASSYNENYFSLQRQFGAQSLLVNYKGSPQVLNDLVSGYIDLGLIPVTPVLLDFADQGRVRLIASSYHKELLIRTHRIPSVSQTLGVNQFSGFIAIALHRSMVPKMREQLRLDLWTALQDPMVQQIIKDLHILSDSNQDSKWIANHFQTLRANMQQNRVATTQLNQ